MNTTPAASNILISKIILNNVVNFVYGCNLFQQIQYCTVYGSIKSERTLTISSKAMQN